MRFDLGAGALDGLGALEDEAGTEVFRADVLVGGQFLRRALLEDHAFIQQIGPVGDGEGLTDVVVGDDDADIAVFQLRDDVLDVLHGDRVDPGEGFVQQDELRVHGEGAGDLAAAAFTAGELDTLALAHLGEVEFVDEPFQALLPLGLGHPAGGLGHLHDGHDVVLHRHLAEHGGLLREVADPLLGTLVHRELRDLLVVQEDLAVIRNHLSRNHIETRRLAGAVRAEEADDLSLVDLHRDALHHGADAVFLDKVRAVQFHLFVRFGPDGPAISHPVPVRR